MTDITIDNGSVRLAASVYGPADAEPIVFLHGISLSRDTWEEIAQRLASRYLVWTLDFRGHGHSDWTPSYELAGYVADAEAVLAAIGRPAIVVGHSLGGCVAGVLAQAAHPNVRAAFLEDPPWYLGEPSEWKRSAFPNLFVVLSARQATWHKEHAPLATYLDFVSSSPSAMGGIVSDHIGRRHLLSHASALQRQDARSWGDLDGKILAAIATGREFRRPTRIIQADPRFGAALLDGHEARLAKTNPHADIIQYHGCGHSPHRTTAFEERFAADLMDFVSSVASH